MTAGSVIEGEVRAVGRGGDAVVETERGIVFVSGALPGERVAVKLEASRRGVARGRLVRVIKDSQGRVQPPCPYVSRCGGCPLMIAEALLQQQIKLSFLEDACRGLPGASELELRWEGAAQEYAYRRRARFAWNGGALGYRVRKSKRIADIDTCMILSAPLQSAWHAVRATLGKALRGRGEIQLQRSGRDRAVVEVRADTVQESALFDACEALAERPEIAGVSLQSDGGVAPAVWGEVEISIGEGKGAMKAPPGSFGQAHEEINEALVQRVVEFAAPEGLRVLELYCGVGNFTLALAARGPASLIAVEQDPMAVASCRDNLARRSLRGRVVEADATRPPRGQYDVLVLDPPRQGARALFEHGGVLPRPKRIVYISCDTATLSRDLELATSQGYRIDQAVGFDMFPQTAHLESVIRLVRR
jgi:23S rRNA (uracil1939-C5)-methyltransferase